MRTNFAGLFLAVGMGLIVVLLGFGALSLAGLVSFAPDGALAEQTMPDDTGLGGAKADSAVVIPTSATATPIAAGATAAIANGDALFKSNCAQCHAVNEKVVGPALAGITKRRPISWLVPWVQNSSKVVASGDEYAVKLFNDNGKQQMPSFPLKKQEIEDIIAWVDSQQGTTAVAYSNAIVE